MPVISSTLGPYGALLFDMDGTILTSIAAVERAWSAWARRIGAPIEEVLSYLHGRRAIDTISHFSPPGTDILSEVRWLDAREQQDMDGIAELPGAGTFLRALPKHRWAVVTSANRHLAIQRMAAAGLPLPQVMITSNDVSQGKPHPEGYQRAAATLGINPQRCLVLEDTRSGVRAGLSAGAEVLHIAGTESVDQSPVKMTVNGYKHLSVDVQPDFVRIVIAS
ncbi:glycerol-3-phosphatase [Sinorhizobium fredii]|uniref:Glycerol-3-phosphatase n=2 Tax=Rhizobium fredii TaxID=380 RepID=A0A2A6M6U6_RHIFR|nr:glycerol-3-phosphatase [Sinorhizobium fredii]